MEQPICGICYQVVELQRNKKAFGILPQCAHKFCYSCVNQWWLNPQYPNHTSCPICRSPFNMVIPSKKWVEDSKQKTALIEDYLKNIEKHPCKFFRFGKGLCPYGNECIYPHKLSDGTPIDLGFSNTRDGYIPVPPPLPPNLDELVNVSLDENFFVALRQNFVLLYRN